MYLTENEKERLLLFLAAELARKRRARGNLLNSPEAYALIADEISEGARDGKSVSDLVSYGSRILTTDDVLPGVEHLVNPVLVEAMFNDGQKLVCIHDPIREGCRNVSSMIPGEICTKEGNILLNKNKGGKKILVKNKGDRPIQVGSHYHFFEVNSHLEFDRKEAIGYRLNIPAGTSVRFEPGDEQHVQLVSLGGNRVVRGVAGLTQGSIDDDEVVANAMMSLSKYGYQDTGS